MSKNTFKLLTRMAPVAILILFASGSASAGSISMLPSSASVTVGQTFQLDIIATALQIGAYDVTFQYNPLMASIDQGLVTFDTHLGGPLNSLQMLTAGLDNLELAEVSFLSPADLAPLQPGPSFPLAHIQVKTLQTGTLVLDFLTTPSTLISDFDGNPITGVVYQGTTVKVNPIAPPPTDAPEPGGALLVAAALGFVVTPVARRYYRHSPWRPNAAQ